MSCISYSHHSLLLFYFSGPRVFLVLKRNRSRKDITLYQRKQHFWGLIPLLAYSIRTGDKSRRKHFTSRSVGESFLRSSSGYAAHWTRRFSASTVTFRSLKLRGIGRPGQVRNAGFRQDEATMGDQLLLLQWAYLSRELQPLLRQRKHLNSTSSTAPIGCRATTCGGYAHTLALICGSSQSSLAPLYCVDSRATVPLLLCEDLLEKRWRTDAYEGMKAQSAGRSNS